MPALLPKIKPSTVKANINFKANLNTAIANLGNANNNFKNTMMSLPRQKNQIY